MENIILSKVDDKCSDNYFSLLFCKQTCQYVREFIEMDITDKIAGMKPENIKLTTNRYIDTYNFVSELDKQNKSVISERDANFPSREDTMIIENEKIFECDEYVLTYNIITCVDKHTIPNTDEIFTEEKSIKIYDEYQLSKFLNSNLSTFDKLNLIICDDKYVEIQFRTTKKTFKNMMITLRKLLRKIML